MQFKAFIYSDLCGEDSGPNLANQVTSLCGFPWKQPPRWRDTAVTFLVLVASFVGLSCVVVPLLLLGAFALFGRDDPVQSGSARRAPTVTHPGG